MAPGCMAISEARSIVRTTDTALHICRPSPNLQYNEQQLKIEPLILKARHRKAVEAAIRETCDMRKWFLQALNVRTNHVQSVVSANRRSGLVLNAFKANATRKLREDDLWPHPFSPWADKGSKRKLWNERSVARAIDYVLNGQGDDLPDFDD